MKNYPLRKEYLICYDISENKIRTHVFKELEKHGLKPAQKSVFWGYLTMAELSAIKRYFASVLAETDKAFVVRSHFNRHKANSESCFFGHQEDCFTDWKEADVI